MRSSTLFSPSGNLPDPRPARRWLKNPVHPGALAKANVDELNISVAEAAKAMRITRQQLHNVMQGRSAVSPAMALRFEKAFGESTDM